jgi:hypothetical protein
MPEWDDLGDMFIQGLAGVIITLIYMLIPIIILLMSVGGVRCTSNQAVDPFTKINI